MPTPTIEQYRHYTVNLTVGPRGEAKHFTRSVYVPDCGPGTKSAAREVIRAEFGARRVVLGRGSVVETNRKGALRLPATKVRAEIKRKAALHAARAVEAAAA